jgi:hypothetical protein
MFDALLDLPCDVIDGWAGSAFPHNAYNPTPEQMAQAIRAFPGRMDRLEQAAQFRGRITRDITMQVLYESVGAKSVLLPCSSWWAGAKVPTVEERQENAVVLYRMEEGVADVVIRRCPGWRMIATTWQDYMWATERGMEAELIADTESLLRIFGTIDQLLSFRIHASIPAASLGCKVVTVAIDSRADTVKQFDMEIVRYDELMDAELNFRKAMPPSEPEVIQTLKGMLC